MVVLTVLSAVVESDPGSWNDIAAFCCAGLLLSLIFVVCGWPFSPESC
jgi:hypothetical protein